MLALRSMGPCTHHRNPVVGVPLWVIQVASGVGGAIDLLLADGAHRVLQCD
jgi:hypothetical protein